MERFKRKNGQQLIMEVGDAGSQVRERCERGGGECDNLKQQVTSWGMN